MREHHQNGTIELLHPSHEFQVSVLLQVQRKAVLNVGDRATEALPGEYCLDQRAKVSKHGSGHIGIPQLGHHGSHKADNHKGAREKGIAHSPPV